jgi:hypothetical protein
MMSEATDLNDTTLRVPIWLTCILRAMRSMITSSMLPTSSGFLSLGRAVRRLISDDGFEDRRAALAAIAEYEQFFLLAASHRRVPPVPSIQVELVWRHHMLDTRADAQDCLRWAGEYLHSQERTPSDASERRVGLFGGSGGPELALRGTG